MIQFSRVYRVYTVQHYENTKIGKSVQACIIVFHDKEGGNMPIVILSPESKFWEGLQYMPCAVNSRFKTGFTNLSLEISHIDFHISLRQKLVFTLQIRDHFFLHWTPGCCTGGGAEPGGGAERTWAWLAGGGERGAGPLPCRRQAARGNMPSCLADTPSSSFLLSSFPACIQYHLVV
jgi:hypothetical protein